MESPAAREVRNVRGTPVTGSMRIFFSEGKRRPIWAEAGGARESRKRTDRTEGRNAMGKESE